MNSKHQPLEYYLEGNKDSKSIIVFLQGWPDNHQVWEPLESAKTLQENRLLFINFPNTSKTQKEIKWGQDFPQVAQRMKATFDEINLNKFQKKVIVAHDWGCFYFYVFDKKYPGQFNDIVALDVPPYTQIQSLSALLMVLIYQLSLIMAFIIGGYFGKLICKGISKFFGHTPKYFDELSGARCYPYFYFYKNKIQGIFNKQKRLLHKYKPSAPVVYIYGKKKPFQFGGDKWNNYLLEHEKCQNHGLDCGHWIMNKYSNFLVDTIKRRLKSIAK